MPTTTYRHYVEGGIILLSQPVNNPTQQPNSQPETLSGFSPLDQRQRGGGPQIIDEKYFADSDGGDSGSTVARPPNSLAAIAAIRGQGLPERLDILQATAEGSLVFDRGESFALHAQRGPLSDEPPSVPLSRP